MSIELKPSGFHEWGDPPEGSLGIDSARIEECVAYFKTQGFRGLFGSPTFGFDQEDLDFLARTPEATHLWFWNVALTNLDALYDLAGLESVGINPKRPGIDFSRFPALRSAVNHWNRKDTGIAASTITKYDLWHFKPRSKTFEGLEIPSGVTELQLFWANPDTLKDLPVMKKLKVLQIHRCRNLQDLSDLPRIAPHLRELLTTTSSKIDATDGVLDHPRLKKALIDGTFVVGESQG